MPDEDEIARLRAERDQQIAEMIDGAEMLYRLFSSYTNAGFSVEQAMRIIVALMARSSDV